MAGPWRVRTQRPSGPVGVNFAHPLARNIAFFYYEAVGGASGTFYDAVTGLKAGTSSGQTQNSDGGLDFNGSARSNTSTAWTNPYGALTNVLTVVAGCTLLAKPAGKCAVIMYGQTGGSRASGVGFDSNGFAGGLVFTSAGLQFAPDATDHLGQDIVIGGSSDGGSGGACLGWVNGVRQTGTGAGTNAGQATATVTLGRDDSGYFNSFNGKLRFAIGFNELLSDAAHQEIAANPWQLLLPRLDFTWLSLPAAGGGGPQNITMTTAALKFAGFALGTNAKTQTAISQGLLKFIGFPEGINGKSMFTITQGTLVFAGRALGIAAGSALTIVLAPLKFAGFVLGVDAKTMTTMQRGLLTFAGFALTVSGTVTLAIPQATLVFTGRALNFVGTFVLRMLSLLGVGL